MKYISVLFLIIFTSSTLAADITVEMLNKRKSDNASMVYSEDISRAICGLYFT